MQIRIGFLYCKNAPARPSSAPGFPTCLNPCGRTGRPSAMRENHPRPVPSGGLLRSGAGRRPRAARSGGDRLTNGKELLILDETQAWPEVFPRLRGAIEADRQRKGRFLLLGSVSPAMMTQVAESLAGRLSLLTLTPFQEEELPNEAPGRDHWLVGAYPEGGSPEQPVRGGSNAQHLPRTGAVGVQAHLRPFAQRHDLSRPRGRNDGGRSAIPGHQDQTARGGGSAGIVWFDGVDGKVFEGSGHTNRAGALI